ncbi:asparaginase [Actinopolymorpha pittospori]
MFGLVSAPESSLESSTASAPESLPVLAEVVRSGFVECRHRGSVVVLDPDGTTSFALGDAVSPIFPRSSNKPMQATAMLRNGLDLDGELLALATASHSGEAFHVEGARRILAGAGLDESALRCPPELPVDEDARRVRILAGIGPEPITMNCSGKHSAMLATCVAAGWPTQTYLDPRHPLQVAIKDTVEELAGEKIAHSGVDGCGAPLFALSLTGLARAFQAMVAAPAGSPEARIVAAVQAHPAFTSGTKRDEAALIAATPGLFGKGGAEGCYAVALADGRAIALKIEDGAQRARPVVMSALLRRLGVTNPVVEAQAATVLHGGGVPVGEIRAVGI